MSGKKKILSGMQTTGKLHIGNLFGALENWVRLQDQYDCHYFAADWHSLSSDPRASETRKENLLDLGVNWLAAGLDPDRSILFIQSRIPAHAILHIYFSMITPLGWLYRVPSYKEKVDTLSASRDMMSYGFLGYPTLQAADILLYKADFVPVGIDQAPHIELTREIARRFHDIYNCSIFTEPTELLSPTPKIPGLDRRKMSKSYDNAIYLSDPRDLIEAKIKNLITDPARARKSDPGDPDKCLAFEFHKLFSSEGENRLTELECRGAKRGCVDCKKIVAKNLLARLDPILERREFWLARPTETLEILRAGTLKADAIARETLAEVEGALNFDLERFSDR